MSGGKSDKLGGGKSDKGKWTTALVTSSTSTSSTSTSSTSASSTSGASSTSTSSSASGGGYQSSGRLEAAHFTPPASPLQTDFDTTLTSFNICTNCHNRNAPLSKNWHSFKNTL